MTTTGWPTARSSRRATKIDKLNAIVARRFQEEINGGSPDDWIERHAADSMIDEDLRTA